MKKKIPLESVWLIIVALFLIMPLVVTFIYSFSDHWISIVPSGFTLQYYADKMRDRQFWMGVLRGLIISAIPVFLTNVILLITMFAVIVYFPKLEEYVQMICMIPTTISGIILATSVLSTYAGSNTIFANRIVMLVCVYMIFCLPLSYQGIRNSLYAVNTKKLLEAASILGANEFYSYLKIIVPSIVPGIMNTALICFAGLFGDFAMIKMIASSQYETVQTYLYKNRMTDIQTFSAGVTILLAITMCINLIMHKAAEVEKMKDKKD